jgi:hypothetical protein
MPGVVEEMGFLAYSPVIALAWKEVIESICTYPVAEKRYCTNNASAIRTRTATASRPRASRWTSRKDRSAIGNARLRTFPRIQDPWCCPCYPEPEGPFEIFDGDHVDVLRLHGEKDEGPGARRCDEMFAVLDSFMR